MCFVIMLCRNFYHLFVFTMRLSANNSIRDINGLKMAAPLRRTSWLVLCLGLANGH